MSTRTIIEINHDYLSDARTEFNGLVAALRHASENELKEMFRYSNAVKVLAQRHHSYDMKVVIASSPYTDLPSGDEERQ